jgi:cation transport protein ChaC
MLLLQTSTWGRAFQFTDEASTLAYLGNRESSLGGYSTVIAQFHPRDPKEEPFPVLVYVALPCNPLFLGPAPIDQIAKDIAISKGQCGYNVEYLAKLAAFMRIHLPNVLDEHLFTLEDSVRKILIESNPELLYLFDEALMHIITDSDVSKSVMNYLDTDSDESNSSSSSSSTSGSLSSEIPSGYADRVPIRKLRCINK